MSMLDRLNLLNRLSQSGNIKVRITCETPQARWPSG